MTPPLFRLPALPWRHELSALMTLAVPLALSQLGLVLMSLTDSVMMGRLSAEALAAGGLASNIGITLIVIPQGLLTALQPIVAQLRGAANHGPFARILAAALCLAMLCTLPIIVILLQVENLLRFAGTDPALAAMALDYAKGFVWGVPFALWQITFRFYLSSLERPRVVMVTIFVACLANVGLNWLLIFGHGGFPMLGLRGSAYATSLSFAGMSVCFTLYAAWQKLLPPGLFQVRLDDMRRGIRELLAIGWAIAGSIIVEVSLFTLSTVLMSRFGPVALAAHQICLGIATCTFMVPMAVGQAGTLRVGFHIGAGQPLHARRAGMIALAVGIGFMCVMALSIRLAVAPIIGLFVKTSDPQFAAVKQIGRELIALAALFQIFDGAQTVAAGVLRGLKDTRAAMLAAMAGYWGLGLPAGIGLAFFLGLGPPGLWWGFVGGLVVVALLLCVRFERISRSA